MLPPFSGVLHCGRMVSTAMRCRAAVLPPSSGRLHCGGLVRNIATRPRTVLPPFSGGLHCGLTYALDWRQDQHVLPPFSGGLHCGANDLMAYRIIERRALAVQRRAPSRLHDCLAAIPDLSAVLQPFNGGLHCGMSPPRVLGTGVVQCSRRSTAGSIAAAGSSGPHPGQVWCSRGSPAGSIAATRPTTSCFSGTTVLPPSPRRAPLRLNQIARMSRCPTCAPAVRRRVPLRRRFRRPVHPVRDGCSRRPTAGSIGVRSPAGARQARLRATPASTWP